MSKDKIISSQEDYYDTINAQRNHYIISAGSFIISLIFGVVAIGAVYFDYTKYEIVNWLILILLWLVSFIGFILFFFAKHQAEVYEKEIVEYQRTNGSNGKVKSVKSFIIRSYISIISITLIIYFLHSLYVR